MPITDYPLIAVTEVLDMPSVDNPYGYGHLGSTEEIVPDKLREVLRYGWGPDEVIENPIHVFEHTEGRNPYGQELTSEYNGRRIMGNGHHRLVFQALVQGALFVHYTTDSYKSW